MTAALSTHTQLNPIAAMRLGQSTQIQSVSDYNPRPGWSLCDLNVDGPVGEATLADLVGLRFSGEPLR